MRNYIFKRLLTILPLLLGITLISFAVIHFAPGKPVELQESLNPKISPELRLRLQKLYGLDKPVYVQYFNWLIRVARLDFGRSFNDNRPVLEKIGERIPLTLTINIFSLIVMFGLSVPIGVRASLRPGGRFDNITTVIIFMLFAAPSFWLALILMQLLCINWNLLPISGVVSLDFEYMNWWEKALDIGRHLFLPIMVSSISGLAGISRYMRSSMIEALNQPYIYTARAKGLSEKKVVYKHAMRNAVIPIVTIVGLSVPGLLGGSVIFESIFALPGIGRLFYEAVMTRDYPLIMAEVVIGAVLTMFGNLFADIAYALVDPRIRYKK